jgi:MoxR-like ATPase
MAERDWLETERYAVAIGEPLKRLLDVLYEAGQVPFLWGAPGIGKTSVVREWASERGLELVPAHLPTMEPFDLRGVPVPDHQRRVTVWLPPETFAPRDKSTVHFLDELNMAELPTLRAVFPLILEGRLGDVTVGGWRIAAGNPPSASTLANELPAPLVNRFCHLLCRADINHWFRWAHRVGIHSSVLTYLERNPDHLYAEPQRLDPTQHQVLTTPRSWHMVSDILHAAERKQMPVTAIAPLIVGWLGRAIGVHFLASLQIGVPAIDPWRALYEPDAPLPADPHQLYGLVKAVAQIVDPMNPEEMQKLEAFAQRLTDEFRIFLAQECAARGVHLPMLDELLDKWRRRRRP